MAVKIPHSINKLVGYGLGLNLFFVYWAVAIGKGLFFHKETEKERLQLALARDEIWNLSKPFNNLTHKFYTLRSGLRLHYVTNNPDGAEQFKSKPLVILLHGYPESYSVWRTVLNSHTLLLACTVVAVDLPGCGGSDSLDSYETTSTYEAISDFVVGMREAYMVDDNDDADSGRGSAGSNGNHLRKVYIIGHDFGGFVAYRFAAEACLLADRFIVCNGPHVDLALANKDRIIAFADQMLATFLKDPIHSRNCLAKAIGALFPLIAQILLVGYKFTFDLPRFMVKYLVNGGNRSMLRGTYGYLMATDQNVDFTEIMHLAACLGPSEDEFKTTTASTAATEKPQSYPASVVQRTVRGLNVYEKSGYYRDNVAFGRWEKSIETVAALHDIEVSRGGGGSRRHSSGASLFEEQYKGALKSPVTILWGQKDWLLTPKICLEGIGDYLAKGSQLVMLPQTGHWPPAEGHGSHAVQALLEWCVNGEKGNVEDSVKTEYDGAYVTVHK